jgi:hypothetical protein
MAIDGNVDLGDLASDDNVFQLAGSLEPALPLPLLLVSASGTAGGALEAYEAGLALPAFALLGASMADGMVLPAFQLAGHMEAGNYISGRLSLMPPLAAGSLEPALQLETLALSASGSSGQVMGAPLLVLPRLELAAGGGDNAAMRLVPFNASGEAITGTLSAGSILLPSLRGGATAMQDTVGEGVVTLGLMQLAGTAGMDAVIDGAVTLDLLQLSAVAGTGQMASADLTVPLFQLSADGHMEAIGSATLLLPAFEVAAEGAGMSGGVINVPRPVLSSVVLNTRLKGVTRYEGLAANSFASFAGVQLAATVDGIVALMGENDLGSPIVASITSGTSDLGSAERKRIEAAFVGYRSMGEMEMTLITDEHHEYTYRLVPRQIADALHSTRVKFGRGVDGRYWQWQLANTNGGAFDLASMQLNVIPLSRAV